MKSLSSPTLVAIRRYLSEEACPAELLSKVLAYYQEAHRVYHGELHLFHLFSTAHALGLTLTVEQAFALLFHDLVYVPGAPAGTNERLSVSLMQALIFEYRDDLGLSVNWALVGEIVLDTIVHKASCEQSKVVLALDLSSLAGSPDAFLATNEQVWLENQHLLAGAPDPRAKFNEARYKFLTELAAKGPLFTAEFSEWEQVARKNIESLAPGTQ
jgi:predicted metal-dependent HD superfamily phosphohydrolase